MIRTALVLFFGITAAASAQETIALVLNLNGHLCAQVVSVKKLKVANQHEVTCIEYRGGSGQVRYILNSATGVAFKAN